MTARFRSKNTARCGAALACVLIAVTGQAQTPTAGAVSTAPAATTTPASPSVPVAGVAIPPGYVIGPEDVLQIVFWRDKDMTTEAVVRPDGRISLPLLSEIAAAGLTPGELHDRILDVSKRYVEDPNLTIVVKQINSRRVFITGEVNKPGPYPLTQPTTVLHLIALAGGLKDFAKSNKIVVVRIENGKTIAYKFNYKEVSSRKNLRQNIELKPGDTVVVPG
jgi:polysaccharide biosynthesis/export protein